jgi:hypothetical protein
MKENIRIFAISLRFPACFIKETLSHSVLLLPHNLSNSLLYINPLAPEFSLKF